MCVVPRQKYNNTLQDRLYGSQPDWMQQKMYLYEITAPSVKCTQYGNFHRAFFILCIDFKCNDMIYTLLKCHSVTIDSLFYFFIA